MEWIMNEAKAAFWIVVGAAMLLFGAFVGSFFGSIGDKIFKKDD